MKVYLAAPWSFKEQAKIVKKIFVDAGFDVVSRWIDLHVPKPENSIELGWAEANEEIMRREAYNDIEDVKECDVLVLMNIQPRNFESTGKAVETGIALILDKKVVLVGDKTNVFHYHDNVTQVNGVTEAIDFLRGLNVAAR